MLDRYVRLALETLLGDFGGDDPPYVHWSGYFDANH